jgi:hypothetical protein
MIGITRLKLDGGLIRSEGREAGLAAMDQTRLTERQVGATLKGGYLCFLG